MGFGQFDYIQTKRAIALTRDLYMNARLLTVVLGLFFLLAFVACGDDGKVSEAPAPAAKKEAPAPVAKKVAPADVISIVDALGQNLEFSAVPERIVTISPTATEMLYLIGGEAVGRDSASNFPKEATSLPDVGSGYDPSIET